MIPEPSQYLSFLIGAPAISDDELSRIGVDIVERFGSGVRGLLIPSSGMEAYKDLVREKLDPGFWNEMVSRHEIVFLFKLVDNSLKELIYSQENQAEIARLCSEFNGDSIEKTSDIPRYLAGNRFYRGLMVESYHVTLS